MPEQLRFFYILGAPGGIRTHNRLIINPIVLGAGNPLFKQNDEILKLKLLNTKSFHNGKVLLYYQPDGR